MQRYNEQTNQALAPDPRRPAVRLRFWTTSAVVWLLYTLTVVLVPPWPLLVRASLELETEEQALLYTGVSGLGDFSAAVAGGAEIDRRQSTTQASKSVKAIVKEEDGKARKMNTQWGWQVVHHLPASEIFGGSSSVEERQVDGGRRKTIHMTFNTCMQPRANTTENRRIEGKIPPALFVFVSNSSSNKSPGPAVTGRAQFQVDIDRGFGSLDFDATGGVWVGVTAPDMPADEEQGVWLRDSIWNYEIAMSTESPYHGYIEDQFLYLVDTDDSSALLITGNMTRTAGLLGGVNETKSDEDLMTSLPPYEMYAQNRNLTDGFAGLGKSYCAIRQLNLFRPASTDVSMTTRGLGNFPKQQFHLKELNSSAQYLGYLARPRTFLPNDTSGILWQPMFINTKALGNCKIIYNLPFCAEVAYAVPANPTIFPDTPALATFYDDIASGWWKNFSYSLQQIQCNASSSAAYSLVRNCDNCAASYKNWLCAVTIPRCMDYTSNLPYLADRSTEKLFFNKTNNRWQDSPFSPPLSLPNGTAHNGTSRNHMIDEVVRPGRYKEIKPCRDLCWSLVQDCPSSLGFACPRMGSWGGEMSYGERDPEGDVTCSYLGAVYFLNSAPPPAAGRIGLLMVVLVVVGWVVV